MCRNTTEAKFITLFYGLLDVDDKTLRYANAGHNAPILTRRDGGPSSAGSGRADPGYFPGGQL
jgi:serine phosphatase RsbU (regulator of sigma subunit)